MDFILQIKFSNSPSQGITLSHIKLFSKTRFNIISHIRLGLPSDLSASRFQTIIVHAYVISR